MFLNCNYLTKQCKTKYIWTGTKVNFVEFVYAIYGIGCINNGNISLKKLFFYMCKIFNIEVNDYARIFMDIKNRTKDDRTKLLDLMKQSLIYMMEKADQRPSRK
jgi:hypothetical protein